MGGKRITAVLLMGAVLSAFAGCGWNGQADIGQGEQQEKTKIKIAWWGGQERHEYTRKLLDKYTQSHPDIEFEVFPSEWDDYFDKLSLWAATGAMPDIVQMDYQYIHTYARNGSLADLQGYMDDQTIHTDGIDKQMLDAGAVDGQMVGMILSTSMLCMGYNPEILKEAGVEEPDGNWTWSDFKEAAGRVTEKTGKPSIVTTAGVTNDTNIFQYWVRQHGKSLFRDDGGALGFDDISITAGFFQMWKELMDQGIVPDPDEMAQIVSAGQDAGPLVTGEAAFNFEWNNYAVKMAGINDKIKITTPPLEDSTGKSGLWVKPGMFFSVAKTSKVQKECAEFIDWFVNSEEANMMVLAERGTPVSADIRDYMVETGKISTQQEEMFQYEESAAEICGDIPVPEPVGITALNQSFNNAANSVYYGKASAMEAAEAFHREAKEILSQNQ